MPDILYADWQGINERKPSHTLKPGELTIAQNVVCKSERMYKIPGTDEHATGLTQRIPWASRYYGIKPDGTNIKHTFLYNDDKIYSVNDPLKTVTERYSGLSKNARPESVLTREGGNNILFLFTGKDVPVEYNGNDALEWKTSVITQTFVQGIWWLDRLWAFQDDDVNLWYSKTVTPTNFEDSTDAGFLPIAAAKGGKIISIMLLGDILYIFKDNGIYYIEGRIPSRFAVRTVVDGRGLASRRAICRVRSAIVLLSQQDNEWYEFNGTETGFKKISENIKFADHLNTARKEQISCTWHNDLFRCSYPDIRDGGIKPEREVIYRSDEGREDGQPKWTYTKGANIDCYAILDRQGDNNMLITGRSDTGKLMVHGTNTNWDEVPMEILVRTTDQLGRLGSNTEFIEAYFSGGVHSGTMNIRYFLDTRNETKGTDTLQETGESSASEFGLAHDVPQTVRYNDFSTLPMGYNIGETLAIEIQNQEADKDFELYEIKVKHRQLHKMRGSIVGG